jgi:hypothetical protein
VADGRPVKSEPLCGSHQGLALPDLDDHV